MPTRILFALVCLLLTTRVASAGTLKSSSPFIYVIDYGDQWIKDPEAVQVFGDVPPDVLHIGKAVPVTHNWGPIPLLAGENQYTGGPGHTLDRDAIRRLPPAELEQKIQDITAAVKRLHAAGIPRVIPYICFYSIAGDHETHEGLWELFDHWDDYARWMGPKPPTGPTDWLTRDATGQRVETGYGLTPPYFAPLHRYAVCPNNPSWNQFSKAIVRLIAQCGYDGVFVDNSTLGGDGCPHCQAAFAKWVGENFDRATLQRACGVDDVGEITLENPPLSPLVGRWHTAVIRDRLALLRAAGAEIKPGFQTFPNVGNYQRVLPLGDGCDLFMFESIEPPGCLVEGELPLHPEALIHVAPDAPVALSTMNYEGVHAETFSEVTAQVRFPRTCPPGQPVEIAVEVRTVGASNQDGDCLEDLRVRLTHLGNGPSEEVRLGPEPGVGDPNQVPGAKRPPVELKGTWTPPAPGPYALNLTYRYTDAEHLDAAHHVPVSDRLSLRNAYRVNLSGLACSYNSRCKTISLWYGSDEEGWENVQELALAEGAANGGRYAINSGGAPQRKYGRFFREHGHVAAGLVPYGAVTLLYAYWGGNPGEIGRPPPPTIPEYLSAQHVLYRGLVDRDLEVSDLIPAPGQTLVLVCRHYDLTEAQIQVLRQFIAAGGTLVLEHPDTRINFAPLAEVLGPSSEEVILWDWDNPPALALALCGAEGRLRGVRCTAFVEPVPQPQRLVLHVLNYNVSVVENHPGEVTPMEDLTVQVPVPGGWSKARAVVYDPDLETPTEVTCTITEGKAPIHLPTLRIYQMVELVEE